MIEKKLKIAEIWKRYGEVICGRALKPILLNPQACIGDFSPVRVSRYTER